MTKILPAKMPKFSNHKGATWDSIPVIFPDGTVCIGNIDTTWGNYVYFTFGDGKWKKVSCAGINENWELKIKEA